MRVGAAIASGILYGLTFPPSGQHWLGWIAVAPLLVALDGVAWRRAGGLGLLWGMVASWATGDWFPGAVARYWDQPAWVGAAGFVVVSFLTGAVQYAAFGVAYARLARARATTTPLVVAAGWVAVELVRTEIGIRNPWCLAGYSQAAFPAAAQIAELTGVYGVSFALIAVNTALAALWTARGDRAGRALAWRGLGVAIAVAGGVVGYGTWRLWTWPSPAGGATVAIVQAAAPVTGQWDPSRYGQNLDVYLALTDEARRTADPALVVWPETAFTFFLEQEPDYQRTIARALGGSPVELVAGGPRTSGADAAIRNAVFLIGADGASRGVYEKAMLLPLAEYFPLGTEALVRRSFGGVTRFAPGAADGPLPTAIGSAGVLVCNEAFFPDLTRARVRDGAQWLAVLANDSWVSEPRYAENAAAMAVFRAIESRRDVVRASTWGPSGVVDARGVVGPTTALGARTVTAGTVTRREGRTPYGVVGDVFAIMCAATAVVEVASARRSRIME